MYENSFTLKTGGGSSAKIKMCARICTLKLLRHRIDFRARAFAASSSSLRRGSDPMQSSPIEDRGEGRPLVVSSDDRFHRVDTRRQVTAAADDPLSLPDSRVLDAELCGLCARLLSRGCGCTVIYRNELFFRFGFEVRGWLGFWEVVISDCEGTLSLLPFRLPFAVIMPRFVFVYNFDDTSNLLRLKCPAA